MVKRYALYEVPDGTADVVLASDYDLQVDAGMKLFEENEKLRANLVEQRRINDERQRLMGAYEQDSDEFVTRIAALEAALKRAHDKLKLCVTAGVLRHDINVFLAAEADILGSSAETETKP